MSATALLLLLVAALALVIAWRLVMDEIDAIAQDSEPMQ